MIKISESKGIEIYAYEKGFFSFANSPYYAHRKALAVDIYPQRGSREALSPVEGKILLIKPISSSRDYVTIIKPEGEKETCIKILHVKPSLKVGERIKLGHYFGEIVWSPFYDFWTDYHLHVEVKPVSDPLRARGGFEIDMTPLIKRMNFSCISNEARSQLTFKVKTVNERYALLDGVFLQKPFSSPLMVRLGGFIGYLDGGVPHYGHGALIGRGKLPNNKQQNIFGIRSSLDHYKKGYLHFNYKDGRILVNDEIYRGISVYINDKFLKLVPLKLGKINLDEGEEIIIESF